MFFTGGNRHEWESADLYFLPRFDPSWPDATWREDSIYANLDGFSGSEEPTAILDQLLSHDSSHTTDSGGGTTFEKGIRGNSTNGLLPKGNLCCFDGIVARLVNIPLHN